MNARFEKRKETKKRHENMVVKVYEVKIDDSKLTKRKKDYFNGIFRESKWIRNYFLGQGILFSECDCTIDEVTIKVGDHFETRELQFLSSQMKQGEREQLIKDCKTLKALKEAGFKIGPLKFKPYRNAINLNQHGVTYTLDIEHNQVHFQKLKGWVKVHGLEQIKGEVTNATLLRRETGIFLHITTWQEPEEKVHNAASIGIDAGCAKALTLSNGLQADWDFPVNKKIKKLDRKIMKKRRKRSNNKLKDQAKRRKEYENLANKKKDTRNKVASVLKKNFEYINVQDESIKAWHAGRHGKRVQNTGLGGLYKVLKTLASSVVDKFYPSTQLCPQCGHKRKLSLSERTYECMECGFTSHRDLKAARCIEYEGLRQIPTEYRKFIKLGENQTSAEVEQLFQLFDRIPHVGVSKLGSLSQEAATPLG